MAAHARYHCLAASMAAASCLLATTATTTATTATTTATTATGTMAGVVTNAKGHPLAGICVQGLSRHRPFPSTNAKGAYSIKLRPGTYRSVSFMPGCGNSGNWLGQWHTNGKFPYKPAPVVVTAGHTTKINAKLVLGGEITGRVTSASGRLLAGVCIQLYNKSTRYVASPNFGNVGLITTRTPFNLTSVPAGRYRILFFTDTCGSLGNYAQRWWRNAQDFAGATIVTIRPGRVITGMHQSLPAGGVITGQVTGQGGVPLAGVCVEFDGPKYPGILDEVSTNSDGRYRGQALTTHAYTVYFDPSCGGPPGPYQGQQYPGTVTVTDGKVTTGINAQLTLSS